jgi:hypothetical protein
MQPPYLPTFAGSATHGHHFLSEEFLAQFCAGDARLCFCSLEDSPLAYWQTKKLGERTPGKLKMHASRLITHLIGILWVRQTARC